MPEGPEVNLISKIVKSCEGMTFSHAEIISKPHFQHKYVKNGIPGFDKLQKPFTINQVTAKGKLIRIDLTAKCQCKESCKCKDLNFSIINTLGMSGTWGHDLKNHDHARIVLHLEPNQKYNNLTFIDQRSFGTIKIVTPAAADKKMKKIGWDLLQSPMPPEEWRKIQPKLNSMTIGEALMTQNKFSGIGNIYKAEILHEVGIHPQKLVANIDQASWARINITSHQIMQDSLKHGGSSVQSYMANGQKGNYQNHLKVYKKKKCPKDHDVTSVKQDDRSSWFCPICQIEE